MRIRHKYYPYPVMERVGRSYKEFSFEVTTAVKREGYNIVFEFTAEIADEQISKLIKEGKAVFAYHIQCAQTCYRAAFETTEKTIIKIIREDELNGLVEVCPFIIAKEDIKAFSSENFSSDYMGIRFDIDKGGILAIGDQSEHTINKDLQDLNNAASPFLVIPNPAATAENMSVELNEKKIYVVLPQEQHGIYRSMGHSRSAQKAMHAMIFVPALMSVFEELRRRLENTGDFADLSEYQWIRALEKVAEKRFNKTLEELLLAKEPLELSQMFLKNPMNDAFEMYRR